MSDMIFYLGVCEMLVFRCTLWVAWCVIFSSGSRRSSSCWTVWIIPIGKIRNEFNKDVSFDCLFQKMPHLEVKAEPTVLKPNESVDVPIVFTPREVKKYLEHVPFELNGLYTVNISIAGEVSN